MLEYWERGGESVWALNTTFNHNMYSLNLSAVFNGLSFMHSIHYCIINNIIHQCIINSHRENIHKYTVHQYLHGNPMWGETMECFFLYVLRSTFIGNTNFLIFQLQLEGGYEHLFIGSNLKEATTHWILWIQLEGG